MEKGVQEELTTLTDNSLMERIREGDQASFETLFHRHYDRVYGLLFRLVGNRVEAEDLTQEAFIKLYHHAFAQSRISRRLRRFGQEENIGGWLYRVATNLGYDTLKGNRRRGQRDTLLLPESPSASGAEEEAARRERRAAVRRVLSRLPQRQVQLLVLRQMDFSYAELAEVCGVAPGSVGTLLARAAKSFKDIYEKEFPGVK